jgi:site-specific DNA recombinase
VILVYKVDRPTRSRADFAKPVELFDEPRVSFVSVTQAFNTTTSVGRLTLNVLLSFAQFEREVSAELQPAEAKRMSARQPLFLALAICLCFRIQQRSRRSSKTPPQLLSERRPQTDIQLEFAIVTRGSNRPNVT